jgi:hypothetical protein
MFAFQADVPVICRPNLWGPPQPADFSESAVNHHFKRNHDLNRAEIKIIKWSTTRSFADIMEDDMNTWRA